ncbi:MAG: hypothetical protein FJW40_25160 [Acidobacteria bacterium]|nr:hypothetical protein [Acidobacteriota bacterium]
MTTRFFQAAALLPLTLLPLALAAPPAAGPRTPDGKPDFSGVYDIASLTPLTRPKSLGDRLTLTDAEAQTIARQEEAVRQATNRASDPNRKAPPVGGDGSLGPAGNVGGYNSFWVDRGQGAFKIDGKWRTSILTDPPDGQMPPLTPLGKELAARRAVMGRPNRGDAFWITENMKQGPYDDPELRPLAERCLLAFGASAGPPMLPVMYNNLKQIVQTKDRVLILNEMVHDVRVIRLNAQHDPPEIRKWLGDSIGHWEGDTLVVDTTNFTDSPGLGQATRNLHIIERFTRLDAKTLSYKFTVEDPTIWTRPWSGEVAWPATDQRIYEYACHEGNYSFTGILKGARVLEADALKKLGK